MGVVSVNFGYKNNNNNCLFVCSCCWPIMLKLWLSSVFVISHESSRAELNSTQMNAVEVLSREKWVCCFPSKIIVSSCSFKLERFCVCVCVVAQQEPLLLLLLLMLNFDFVIRCMDLPEKSNFEKHKSFSQWTASWWMLQWMIACNCADNHLANLHKNFKS